MSLNSQKKIQKTVASIIKTWSVRLHSQIAGKYGNHLYTSIESLERGLKCKAVCCLITRQIFRYEISFYTLRVLTLCPTSSFREIVRSRNHLYEKSVTRSPFTHSEFSLCAHLLHFVKSFDHAIIYMKNLWRDLLLHTPSSHFVWMIWPVLTSLNAHKKFQRTKCQGS
jgi:hypothetical protein